VKREQRLRSAADFRRVRAAAPRGWPHPLLVVYATPNDLGYTRAGITVSGRVGKAVVRNRVRRRLREALRPLLPELTPGVDLLLIARPTSASASWADLRQAVLDVLRRAGLRPPSNAAPAAARLSVWCAVSRSAAAATIPCREPLMRHTPMQRDCSPGSPT
jgi:ribonuclease P protein component